MPSDEFRYGWRMFFDNRPRISVRGEDGKAGYDAAATFGMEAMRHAWEKHERSLAPAMGSQTKFTDDGDVLYA